MSFRVVWRRVPGREEVRSASFEHQDQAVAEAEAFRLSVTGSVETVIYDRNGVMLSLTLHHAAST